jgi:G3E family GTPase
VISGFLGSGKTTLVRHLLHDAQREGQRVAVISNELGELGIDQALLGAGGEAFVELTGGCVCCQLTDELVETLEALRRRVDPDRVIVETSGVALPHDTQLQLWRAPVAEWIGDDLAVVVVNAEQVAAGRALEGTFEDQVGSADLLLLNKVDLVGERDLEQAEARLALLAPEAPVVRTLRAEVAPALLFPPEPGRLAPRTEDPRAHARPHVHERFAAEELRIEPGLPPDALERRIRASGALRAKGFVLTSLGLRALQAVGPRVELEPVAVPPPAELIGRVVLIRPVPS